MDNNFKYPNLNVVPMRCKTLRVWRSQIGVGSDQASKLIFHHAAHSPHWIRILLRMENLYEASLISAEHAAYLYLESAAICPKSMQVSEFGDTSWIFINLGSILENWNVYVAAIHQFSFVGNFKELICAKYHVEGKKFLGREGNL